MATSPTYSDEEDGFVFDRNINEQASFRKNSLGGYNQTARRRSYNLKTESHPQRQSTPRRRLREAQLADKVFCSDDNQEPVIPSLKIPKVDMDSVSSITATARALVSESVSRGTENILKVGNSVRESKTRY